MPSVLELARKVRGRLHSDLEAREETKADYIQKSYQELQYFFDELRKRRLTKHFSDERLDEEYYDFNEYGAYNGQNVGEYEFRIVHQGRNYHLHIDSVLVLGDRVGRYATENDTKRETFESNPISMKYWVRRYSPKETPSQTLIEKAEVTNKLFPKKGSIDQAKIIHDRLLAFTAKAYKQHGISPRNT